MTLPRGMVSALAELCERRFHSARGAGMSERAAFEEIVETILEMYIEATGQEPKFQTHDGPEAMQ